MPSNVTVKTLSGEALHSLHLFTAASSLLQHTCILAENNIVNLLLVLGVNYYQLQEGANPNCLCTDCLYPLPSLADYLTAIVS